MAQHRLPIWMHPARPASFPDYQGETRSKFDIWWAFGWPYETTAAMARLVFDGLFERHPDLQIITHHMGAMVPHFEGRAGYGLDQLGTRTDDPDDVTAPQRLTGRPVDHFRKFYGDTACSGRRTPWSAASPSSAPTVSCSAPTCPSTPSGTRVHPRDHRGDGADASHPGGESEDLRGERPPDAPAPAPLRARPGRGARLV